MGWSEVCLRRRPTLRAEERAPERRTELSQDAFPRGRASRRLCSPPQPRLTVPGAESALTGRTVKEREGREGDGQPRKQQPPLQAGASASPAGARLLLVSVQSVKPSKPGASFLPFPIFLQAAA